MNQATKSATIGASVGAGVAAILGGILSYLLPEFVENYGGGEVFTAALVALSASAAAWYAATRKK